MKLFYIVSLMFAATIAFEIKGRITGGNKATEGQFPHQVGLRLEGRAKVPDWCGGSLIGTEWVLTAAHCLAGVEFATVFLGTTVRVQSEVIRFALKENFIIHHGFNGTTLKHDISLIKIPSVALNAKIQTIKLPSLLYDWNSDYTNTFAIASGWGQLSDKSDPLSPHLQWARFEVMSNDVCAEKLDSHFPALSFCVSTRDGMSPCYGDSGGPLVSEKDGCLIGVLSFLSGKDCELGYPVGFVRVTYYLDWIYNKTGISY